VLEAVALPKEIVEEDVGRKDPALGDVKEKTGKMWVCVNRPVYRLSLFSRAPHLYYYFQRGDLVFGDVKEKTDKMWVCVNPTVSSSYRRSFSSTAPDLYYYFQRGDLVFGVVEERTGKLWVSLNPVLTR
jgi:hypothetical protein